MQRAGWPWSVEARAMMRPAETYRELAARGPSGATWWKRPALLLLLLGCGVSFLVSGRLTLRLVLDGIVSFAFVPLCAVAGLAAIYRTRSEPPFTAAVDMFFAGNGPWLVWLVVMAGASCVVRPIFWSLTPLEVATLAAIAWSAYLDFHYFREVTNRSRGAALRAVVWQRAIAWSCAAIYFFGIALWPEIAGRVWR